MPVEFREYGIFFKILIQQAFLQYLSTNLRVYTFSRNMEKRKKSDFNFVSESQGLILIPKKI